MTESKMEKIAADMLLCRTLKEVAEKNGITERTLRRIRNTDDFQRILTEARSKAFEGVFDVVCAAAPESAMQLIEIMRDPKAPASARVSASRSILDFAQRYSRDTEVFDRISALEKDFRRITYEDIKRLERLERRLESLNAINTELEDLSETDLELYGNEVIKEIYQIYGPDHLKAMLDSPTLSGESKIIIADFLCRIDETPWRN